MQRVKHVNGGGGGNGEVRRIREAPHVDIAAERSFLGGCLLKPELIMQSGVVRGDFYAGQLAIIWDAILAVHADGEEVTTDSVRARLDDRGQLEAVGGVSALLELTDTIPTVSDFNGRRIRKLAKRRAVAAAARRVTEAAADAAADDSELRKRHVSLDDALRELDTVEGTRSAVEVVTTRELFAPLPPPSFVIPGLRLGEGRPAMWAGYGASAKTLAAQALALAVASGTPAWGHFEIPTAGVVLHLDYEQGRKASARRYQRLAVGLGIDQARLGNRLRYVPFPTLYLDQPDAADAFARTCEGVSLVIIDAFRGATPTKDENDSSIRSCLDVLSRVSDRTGATFFVLHHAGKPKDAKGGEIDYRTGPRGSSGIFDACGAVFHVDAAKKPDEAHRVTPSKAPADAEGQKIEAFGLRVEDVEIAGIRTAGVRVAWSELAAPPTRVEKVSAKHDADMALMLELVRVKAGQCQDDIVTKCGIGRNRAIALLKQLERDGRVFVQKGDGGKHLYRLSDASGGGS